MRKIKFDELFLYILVFILSILFIACPIHYWLEINKIYACIIISLLILFVFLYFIFNSRIKIMIIKYFKLFICLNLFVVIIILILIEKLIIWADINYIETIFSFHYLAWINRRYAYASIIIAFIILIFLYYMLNSNIKLLKIKYLDFILICISLFLVIISLSLIEDIIEEIVMNWIKYAPLFYYLIGISKSFIYFIIIISWIMMLFIYYRFKRRLNK